MSNKLHIVSFDVPYPPNYGGAIDVFYKIKALAEVGVKIHLHIFEYGRGKQKELEKYCDQITYYPRNSFLKSLFSKKPFIVQTRANDGLIDNLNKDLFPVLFEGLHTTTPLISDHFIKRPCFVRAHNIEHNFYLGLAESETSIRKKNFYKLESKKLKSYESVLKNADGIFSISPLEQSYFIEKFGKKSKYIPAFHDTEIHTKLNNSKPTILYHGNMIVSENVKAAKFLIDIYKDSPYELIIASNIENKEISDLVKNTKNIQVVLLTDSSKLNTLFEKAQINVLPTFQNTGIKLKLLNTLYQGKFIIANDFMIDQTGLESLCVRANTKEEFLAATEDLLKKEFTQEERENRLALLKEFDPIVGAQKIVKTIFK